MNEHNATYGQGFLEDHWEVECPCGFLVTNLSTREAAIGTVRFHMGEPSALGGTL